MAIRRVFRFFFVLVLFFVLFALLSPAVVHAGPLLWALGL